MNRETKLGLCVGISFLSLAGVVAFKHWNQVDEVNPAPPPNEWVQNSTSSNTPILTKDPEVKKAGFKVGQEQSAHKEPPKTQGPGGRDHGDTVQATQDSLLVEEQKKLQHVAQQNKLLEERSIQPAAVALPSTPTFSLPPAPVVPPAFPSGDVQLPSLPGIENRTNLPSPPGSVDVPKVDMHSFPGEQKKGHGEITLPTEPGRVVQDMVPPKYSQPSSVNLDMPAFPGDGAPKSIALPGAPPEPDLIPGMQGPTSPKSNHLQQGGNGPIPPVMEIDIKSTKLGGNDGPGKIGHGPGNGVDSQLYVKEPTPQAPLIQTDPMAQANIGTFPPNPLPQNPLPQNNLRPTAGNPQIAVANATLSPTAKRPTANVGEWDERKHICGPGDTTFAALSQQYYHSDKYAQALIDYNRQTWPDKDAVRKAPYVDMGKEVWIPPVHVLEARYDIGGLKANAVSGVAPKAADGGSSLQARPIDFTGGAPIPVPVRQDPPPMGFPAPGAGPSVNVTTAPQQRPIDNFKYDTGSIVPPTPTSPNAWNPPTNQTTQPQQFYKPVAPPTIQAPVPNPAVNPNFGPTSSKVYTVPQGGQKYYEIARDTLGDATRWSEIYNLNPQIDPAFMVPEGTQLKVPTAARSGQ